MPKTELDRTRSALSYGAAAPMAVNWPVSGGFNGVGTGVK